MFLEMLSISLIVPVITFILSDDIASSYFFYDFFIQISGNSKEKLLIVTLLLMVTVYLVKTSFITILIYFQAKFNYNLRAKPAEILVKGSSLKVITKRQMINKII